MVEPCCRLTRFQIARFDGFASSASSLRPPFPVAIFVAVEAIIISHSVGVGRSEDVCGDNSEDIADLNRTGFVCPPASSSLLSVTSRFPLRFVPFTNHVLSFILSAFFFF